MKLPWHDKTGLAKATAIFATVAVVSLGLCGANFFAVVASQGPPPRFLMVMAYTELLGMIVGAAGLIVIAIIAIGTAIFRYFYPPDNPRSITKGDD